jgi:hypothetical protein
MMTGCQLAAVLRRHEDPDIAIAVLLSLFAEFGKPQELKGCNGSRSNDKFCDLPRQQGGLLLSPSCTPRCNRACEAGFGALKPYLRENILDG